MAVDILSRRARARLERFLAPGTLYVFDFDGTLAPIVRRPGTARMRRSTHARLIALSRRAPCALVTGRALRDVRPRVRGVRWAALVGNHGLEARPALAPLADVGRRVGRWRRALEDALAEIPGVEIEDKRYSLSVHYRKARDKERVKRKIFRAARALAGARLVGGKQVLNVTVRGALDKGKCVRLLRRKLGCRRAVYLGDDVTDQDVFRLRAPWLLDVRVGKAPGVSARFSLGTQREVDAFLDTLLHGPARSVRPR